MDSILAATADGRWRPGIGDPTIMGWVTVAAYCLAAGLCGLVAWRTWRQRAPHWRTLFAFWAGLTVIMALLGINKQLDLQSLFTQIGRDLAKEQGWYDQRQLYQREFIFWLVIVSVGSFSIVLLLLLDTWRQTSLALLGLVFLLTFILTRAASFHHVDHLLGVRWIGIKLNWLFELGGVSAIVLSAGWNLVSARRQRESH